MRVFFVLMLSSSFLFFGCGAVSDMKDMFAKQGLVQETIKENYGLQSQVGWNIHNGILKHVTVIFFADEVRDKKVAELEVVVQEAVYGAFESTPQALNLQIAANQRLNHSLPVYVV